MDNIKKNILNKLDDYFALVISNEKIGSFIEVDDFYKDVTIKEFSQLLKIDKLYDIGLIEEDVKDNLINIVKNPNKTESDIESLNEYRLNDLNIKTIINILVNWERLTDDEYNKFYEDDKIPASLKKLEIEAKMKYYGVCMLNLLSKKEKEELNIENIDCNNYESCSQCVLANINDSLGYSEDDSFIYNYRYISNEKSPKCLHK